MAETNFGLDSTEANESETYYEELDCDETTTSDEFVVLVDTPEETSIVRYRDRRYAEVDGFVRAGSSPQNWECETSTEHAWNTHLDEVIESVALRARLDTQRRSGSPSSDNSFGSASFDVPGQASGIKRRRGPTEGQCEYCGITLRHPSKIAAHLRTHTGERPFECTICHRSFTQRTPWRVHMKRHYGDTPFRCPRPVCIKSFPTKSTLKAHILRYHEKQAREGPPKPHLKPQKVQARPPSVPDGPNLLRNFTRSSLGAIARQPQERLDRAAGHARENSRGSRHGENARAASRARKRQTTRLTPHGC
ncbi:Zinc fingerC2H2 type family protein [Aphelenchoides avenae]|nr:Zinc fingerC2H2 type family protein [Aphelenchus avenae]